MSGETASGPSPAFIDQVIKELKQRDEFLPLDLAAELIEIAGKVVTILDDLSDIDWMQGMRLNLLDRRVNGYPHSDGDVTVLGPETFVSEDKSVICWQGENYYRRPSHE